MLIAVAVRHYSVHLHLLLLTSRCYRESSTIQLGLTIELNSSQVLLVDKVESFQFTNRQKLTCQMSGEERQTPWEHGAAIAKAIKSVEIEGLTGPIRLVQFSSPLAGGSWRQQSEETADQFAKEAVVTHQ